MKTKMLLTLMLLLTNFICQAQDSDFITHVLVSNKTITKNTTVEYTHNLEIILTDGFHAENGSNFHAYITNSKKESEILPKEINTRLKQEDFSIYPNPCSNKFSISNNNQELTIKEIGLFDTVGNLILRKDNPISNDFDVSYLPYGIYYIRIVSSNNKIYHQKLIKY